MATEPILYDPEHCPCPRGAQGICPRYRDCDACRANHRSKGEGSLTACEKRAAQEKEKRNMSKVNDFLTETGSFFLATVDGDRPRLRPLGLHVEKDGRLLFGVGDFKNVYRQLLANPKCEISALKPDGHWLRYSGKAVFVEDPALEEAVLDGAPYLRSIYNPETGHHLKLFYLADAAAVDIPMMGPGEDLLN